MTVSKLKVLCHVCCVHHYTCMMFVCVFYYYEKGELVIDQKKAKSDFDATWYMDRLDYVLRYPCNLLMIFMHIIELIYKLKILKNACRSLG